MKNIITLILGLIFTSLIYAQTEIKVRISQTKLDTKTELLIPNGDSYIYEKYSDFKHVFWLLEQDTLLKTDDNKFVGSKITIELTNDFISSGYCDTLINEMRNSGLNSKSFGMLDDTARAYIGYGNKEYLAKVREKNFKYEDFSKTCHNDFVEMNSKWFDNLLQEIYIIRGQKQNRLSEAQSLDTIPEKMITDFLTDYGYCPIDKELGIVIITKNAEGFSTVCDNFSDTEFYGLKLFFSDLPDGLDTKGAVFALEQIDKKSKRTKILIRKLRKNEG